MRTIYIIVMWFTLEAFAMDFPGDFVQNPGGSLALSGLPGYKSTPARYFDDSTSGAFGVAYARVPEADLQVVGLVGEMNLWFTRLAFFSSYLLMDSLYRQVYSEIDFSLSHSWVVGGVGYGLSVDWIPGAESWTSNRYKAGVAFLKGPLSLSAMTSLVNHRSYCNLDYALAFRFEGNRFGAFVEYDGYSIDVGNSITFSHAKVLSAYRFPEFAVAVSLVFGFSEWSLSGAFGNARPIWDWFGFTMTKSIRKKTIL